MEIRELVIIAGILLSTVTAAALLVWVERRLLGFLQDRCGPNRVGPFGILQIVADITKLFFKEDWVPPFADKAVYVIAPVFVVFSVFMSFSVISFAPDIQVSDLNVGLLFFLAMSSLGVYSIVLGGWASNNKYALLGALRGAAQMITYEVFMGLSLMGVVMMADSLSLKQIVEAQQNIWFCVPQFLGFMIFFIAGVAEARRLPFDLPEAESELVAGYHTEYTSMKFGMFYLGEYLGITFISSFIVVFFFGGWLGPPILPPAAWFAGKTLFFIFLFILLRASLPRLRYDQLMKYGWKVLLPLSLLNLVATGVFVLAK
jgi:NADH-quinone oxidoreductase subunit H